jgi:hypothetical protein
MKWGLILLGLCSFLTVAAAQEQGTKPPAPVDPAVEAASVGLTLTPVPELLYEQLPSLLHPGTGVVVERVLPMSAAEQTGLRRHDIVLSFHKKSVQNADHFARLLRAAPPDRKTTLVVLRGGKEVTLEAAGLSTRLLAVADPAEPPKGLIKPGGPPAVHVVARPLDGGKMEITFTFYSEGKGKLDHLACTGSLDEIEVQLRMAGEQKRMPAPVRDLADATLKRIRTLKTQP